MLYAAFLLSIYITTPVIFELMYALISNKQSPILVIKNKIESSLFTPVHFLNTNAVNENAVIVNVKVVSIGNKYLPI